jgi:hypothetical protein
MLIGVLFLAILGGDQVLSGVLKCRCNSPEEVVSGWGCRRLRPEKAGGGERVLTRILKERGMSSTCLQAVVVGKLCGGKVLVPIVVVDGDKGA